MTTGATASGPATEGDEELGVAPFAADAREAVFEDTALPEALGGAPGFHRFWYSNRGQVRPRPSFPATPLAGEGLFVRQAARARVLRESPVTMTTKRSAILWRSNKM